MDEIFKSEVIVVVMEKEKGVSFGEFAGLFHQVHGYQLKLTNYGYKSLKDLLDDMKDDVEIQNVNGQQLIKCRPPCPLNVIAPDISEQNNEPIESCSSSSNKCGPQSGDIPLDEFLKEQQSCKKTTPGIRCHKSLAPARQSTLQSQEYLASEVYCTNNTCLTKKQMPSEEIVKIISQKMKSHHAGLRATKLREYILEQHKIDLELYSQELGYTDMLSMLREIPVIKVLKTSRKKFIIASHFCKNLSEDQDTPSAKVETFSAGPSSTSRSTPSASPSQKNDPIISETCTTYIHDPRSKTDPAHILPVDGNAEKKKSFNTTQKPSEEIVKKNSETVINHHFGLPLGSHDKHHNSQPEQPKRDQFSLNKVADVLRLFPSGLKIEKLKQLVLNTHHIDLEAISIELGYTDMPSMLKQVPGITSLNGEVFFASDIPKSKKKVARRKKVPFSEKFMVDFLKMFPSGLKIETLMKHVNNKCKIDLMKYSQEKGFIDMADMLQKVPGIQVVNKNLIIASDVYKKSNRKSNATITTTAAKCPINAATGVTKSLHVEIKRPQVIQTVMKPSTTRPTGTNQQISLPTRKIPLTNATINSPQNVHQQVPLPTRKIPITNAKINSSPNVQQNVSLPPRQIPSAMINSSQNVRQQVSLPPRQIPLTNATINSPQNVRQQVSLPTRHIPLMNAMINSPQNVHQQEFLPHHQIPSTNALIKSPQNVHQGLLPNVSYASACASNLRKNQMNVQSLKSPPTFNVQKAHTAKIAHPNHKAVPNDVMQGSNIKDKLQLLLKSHVNGLSVFQLKKLYLLMFQQPLVCRGMSVRKLLKNMEDVANITGVGVQMKVFPVLSEDNLSATSKICSDSTPRGAAVSSPLSIKNNTEPIKHSVPVLQSKQQPSSSGHSHTELTGGHLPNSGSGDISHRQTLYQTTEICDRKLVTTAISHSANNLHPAGDAENINDAQWPSLPQKFNILKEIKQRSKVSDQLIKQNPTTTSQPQGKDNSAKTLLKADQDPYKPHDQIDYRGQEPQTSDLAHPLRQPGFSFVLEETGFSFLKGETNLNEDKKSKEMGLIGPPPNTFTDSTQVGFELSGLDTKRNTLATPIQLNQSAHCNMAAPEARRHSVNVLLQQSMADFSSKKMAQQTHNHLETSEFSTQDQKSNNSQSQPGPTHNNNVFDSLLLDLKRQQGTLQEQGTLPRSSDVQIVSVLSKEQQETSSSKSICEFGQMWSTPPPSKQEVAKSNLNNKTLLTVSPKSQSPEMAPISKTKTEVGTQNVPTEKSPSGVQTTSNGRPVSSPVSQFQQVPITPFVDTEGSPVSATLHKDIDLNIVNGEIILKTQKKERVQIRDGVDGTKTLPSSSQQKANIDHVYIREQTVTEPFQTQPKVPVPHASSSMEQSRASPRIHHNYNDMADRTPEQKKIFTSKSYQHVSHWDHSVPPVLSGPPTTPTNQQDSSGNSSEESTKTWQKDGDQFCCIL